jgi:hypothetical protein
MTQSTCLFVSLVLAALPANVVAAPGRTRQSGRAAGDEPFRSFGLLDQKLTLLSNQQSALKTALGAGRVNSSSGNSSSQSATVILRRMSSTTTAIERIAGRLGHLYQSRGESFGVRMFKILRSRAQAVQRDVSSVRRARTVSDASVAGKRLDEHIVSLVIQFQAAVGGYGATHCLPGTRVCCQPKRSQDLPPGEQIACKWACVSNTRACAGFLGPRIPQSPAESRQRSGSK